jgi:hypothetical protein
MSAFVLAATASPTAQSRATLVPALGISTVHDDNLFTIAKPTGDLMTQLRPSVEGMYESPHIDLQSLFYFDMQMSARHSGLNTFDARRHGLFDGRVRSSPSVTLGLAARYDKTETPGELNLESAVLHDRQRARRWQFTPSIGYRVNPRTTITTMYDYTNEKLEHQMRGDLHVGRVGVARQSSPRTTWSVHYLGRLFVDPTDQHRSHSPLFGWSRDLAPGANLTFRAGPRFTSYRGMSSEILAAFIRRTPRTRFLIDYWHGETIILGIRGPVSIQSGTTKYSWSLRRNLDIGTHFGLFNSKTLDRAEAMVFNATVVGAWSFRDPYTLTVSYGADFQKGDIRSHLLSEEKVRRGVFVARLTIAPRFSRAFKPEEDESREPSTPMKGVVQ